jgi:thiol-disulfide isomerase/thioredoxin
VVVLAVATIVAFTAGDGSGDVVEVDPNAPFTGADGLSGTDVTGQQLPSVTYETFGGDEVALRTDGKPLLVNFWASTCIPCVKEMPDLERTWQQNRDRVDYLGLQVAENAASGTAMLERTGVTYPTGRDVSGEVLRAFGGVGLPRTVLVEPDGTIAYVHAGLVTADQVQAAIDALDG